MTPPRSCLWFIGVSTRGSSIMRVFPAWAGALGLDARVDGLDFPPGVDPSELRGAVAGIKADPGAAGALVTTHKIDLLKGARDLFDELDGHALRLAEVSCLAKRGGRLLGFAKDPITAGLALARVVPPGHFAGGGGEACLLGGGGAATAIAWNLLHPDRGEDRPRRLVVTDREPSRLAKIEGLAGATGPAVETHLVDGTAAADRIVGALPPGSLVVNATGLGKDGPGSPLGDGARFPAGGVAWELNYRGERRFLEQARSCPDVRVEDGWDYFVYGWLAVIAEVFERPIPSSGPAYQRLADLARTAANS